MANIIRSLKSVRSELSKGKKVSCPDNPEASRKARKFDFIMLLTYLPYNRTSSTSFPSPRSFIALRFSHVGVAIFHSWDSISKQRLMVGRSWNKKGDRMQVLFEESEILFLSSFEDHFLCWGRKTFQSCVPPVESKTESRSFSHFLPHIFLHLLASQPFIFASVFSFTAEDFPV